MIRKEKEHDRSRRNFRAITSLHEYTGNRLAEPRVAAHFGAHAVWLQRALELAQPAAVADGQLMLDESLAETNAIPVVMGANFEEYTTSLLGSAPLQRSVVTTESTVALDAANSSNKEEYLRLYQTMFTLPHHKDELYAMGGAASTVSALRMQGPDDPALPTYIVRGRPHIVISEFYRKWPRRFVANTYLHELAHAWARMYEPVLVVPTLEVERKEASDDLKLSSELFAYHIDAMAMTALLGTAATSLIKNNYTLQVEQIRREANGSADAAAGFAPSARVKELLRERKLEKIYKPIE